MSNLSSVATLAASSAIKAWCKSRGLKLTCEPGHIHVRAQVIGRAAPRCLIVSVPWIDSEPQCQEFDKANPLVIVSKFDENLAAGDWCTTAYISFGGEAEKIAIPAVTGK